MIRTMTKDQFSDLMLGRRFQPAMRNALYQVLVEGRGQTDVAKQFGIHRQQISRAISRLKLNKQ